MNEEKFAMGQTFVLTMQQLLYLGTEMSELCDELARGGPSGHLTDSKITLLRELHEQWDEALRMCVRDSLSCLRPH
jgi:hypothetical protein